MKRLLYVLILLLTPLLWGQGYTVAGGGSVPAGSGTGFLSVGGVLCKAAPAAATAGTAEEVLATCTIPASTLSANGATLRVLVFGHVAANANSKTLNIRIGGIGGAVVCTIATTTNNYDIVSTWPTTVSRTGAATGTSICSLATLSNSASSSTVGAATYQMQRGISVTWANAQDLVITGTTPSAAGDLTLDSYVVEVVQ